MRLFIITAALLLSSQCFSQEKYKITLDLTQVKHDRVLVTVHPPKTDKEKLHYIMPHIIPGTYSLGPYGKLIKKVFAYDKEGNKLKVKRKGKNDWYISSAQKLDKLQYWVGDTYDKLIFIFRPAGTDIIEGNHFMVNHTGFYGYMEGYKNAPYELTVLKPQNLISTTALPVKEREPKKEVFAATGYVQLADNPIQYHVGDTASHVVGKTRVHIAVYSDNGTQKAETISNIIKPFSLAVKEFLGEMPTDEYYYLFYFTSQKSLGARMNNGALEHNNSSVYYLSDFEDTVSWKWGIRDIAAHEFMHIVTPLNLHSEYISDFDFYNAKMSRHLWLYEGCTEYFSSLVQVKAGIMKEKAFMRTMMGKIRISMAFKPYSLTEMSLHTTEYRGIIQKFAKLALYSDIYMKGAVNGFLLDIRIRELSKGQKGLIDVIQQLSDKYGQDKPFNDENFIAEFVAVAGLPALQDYFDKYVVGSKPLPFAEYCKKIGWKVENPTDRKQLRISVDEDAPKEAVELRKMVLH